MLLKSLEMKNFRQYKGDQRVDFSTDPARNVTVILGNNTFGKTTLLQAFNWCLYRKVSLDTPDMLLNYDVAAGMPNGGTEEVKVTISLVHGGKEYTVETSQAYSKAGSSVNGCGTHSKVKYLSDDGQTEVVPDRKADEVIRSILPEDLSDFFFFDTERVANVGERKDLTSSVKSLLGLAVLDNAIAHIGDKAHQGTVIGKLYQDMDEDGDERAIEALRAIQDAQAKREGVAARLAECDEQSEKLKWRKQELDDILRAGEQTRENQKQKERLERSAREDRDALEKTEGALRADFAKNSLDFFTVPLIDRAEAMLKEARLDEKGVRDLTRATLEEILSRNVCVCGLRFDEHPEAVEHIHEEMRFCPPESIGNAVRNYREAMAASRADQGSILQGMGDRQATIAATRIRIADAEDEIEELSRRIGRSQDYAVYEAERNETKSQIKILSERHDALVAEDGALANAIETQKKRHDEVSVISEKNAKVRRYIAYAEELHDWLQTTYAQKEAEVRNRLEAKVNVIFEKMYHGSRKVVIDPRYHVELLSDVANTNLRTGESEGLNRVKSFAFIAGLTSLARDRIVSGSGDSEFDLSSEPYPLVMDAPFSNTDEVHIERISKVLPEAAEQVIMFVMEKDWRYARQVLGAKVGSSYQLDKKSESCTVLKEQ